MFYLHLLILATNRVVYVIIRPQKPSGSVQRCVLKVVSQAGQKYDKNVMQNE